MDTEMSRPITKLYCWKRGASLDETTRLYQCAIDNGFQALDDYLNERPAIIRQLLSTAMRLGTRWPVWFLQKLPWLFSDHGIQTGYLWFPVFVHALRTQKTSELFWRFKDDDLALLRDSIDDEIGRRESQRAHLLSREC